MRGHSASHIGSRAGLLLINAETLTTLAVVALPLMTERGN